jgi:hypothetical protein
VNFRNDLIEIGWHENMEGKLTPPSDLFLNAPSSGFSPKDALILQNLLGDKVSLVCVNPDLKSCDCPACGGFND